MFMSAPSHPRTCTYDPNRAHRSLRIALISLLVPPHIAEFVRWTLVDNRYVHTTPPPTSEPYEFYCWNRELEDELLLEAEAFFTAGLKKVIASFATIVRVAGQDRRDMYLANYIELAVHSIVGTKNTPSFLLALAQC
jgi:hypothetical protein